MLDHLRIHASKPYVAGSIHWALRDFRVDPTWTGGAPRDWSTPPWNNKSLIEESNDRKPVYFELRKRWRKARGVPLTQLLSPALVKRSVLLLSLRARARRRWPAAASAPTTPAAATTWTTARPRWSASRTPGSSARLVGPDGKQEIVIGDGADAPHIKFFLTAGEAEAEQFQGRGEGAEQIGGDAALRRRRQRRPARSRSRSAWPTCRSAPACARARPEV